MADFKSVVLAVSLAMATGVATAQEAGVQAEAAKAPNESLMLLALQGEIAVDATGAVTDVKLTTPVAAPVRDGVERVLRGWRFEPVVEGGVPVAVQARVHVLLSANATPPVTEIRLDSVRFNGTRAVGAAEASPRTRVETVEVIPPRFPAGLLRANAAGEAMMAVRVGLDGRVEAAEVVQSAMYDAKARPGTLADAMRNFEKAALRQARKWRYAVTVPEGQTPTAADLTLYHPIRYSTEDHRGMRVGEWRLVTRTPRVAPSWLPAEAATVGVGEVSGNVASAGDAGLTAIESLGLGAAL
jgi:hypothetical protein